MCGIAGIFSSRADHSIVQTVETMTQAIHHRGPDDAGVWHNKDHTVCLGHRRLSIMDLSPAGHQPMLSSSNVSCITFNGEIYNFKALRASLQHDGAKFHTETDTEVLLAMYERHGSSMLTNLRGMFAFAIWDESIRQGLLARDPFGIKPLYYTVHQSNLYFSSELRAIQEIKSISHTLSHQGLVSYFTTGSVTEPDTLLDGVYCLPPGHFLTWKNGVFHIECYWSPTFHHVPMTHHEATAITRTALEDSIHHHFVSDVPVGIFLSGGIDSTAITALAIATGHNKPMTFSLGVDDDKLDESAIAARTADHFGTHHHHFRLNGKLAANRFETYINHIDQPSIDGFNTYNISAFAREHDMKVVLSGIGGDEMFGGYKSFREVPRLNAIAQKMHQFPLLARQSGYWLERLASSPKFRRLGSLLQQKPDIQNSWRVFRGIFSRREAKLLAAHYSQTSADILPESRSFNLLNNDILDQICECEIRGYMANQLLKDGDVLSMAHGLELRVPLVDSALFDAIAKIPSSLRLRKEKAMLLDAVPEIPPWLLNQPKRGFVLPYESWLKDHWNQDFGKSPLGSVASRFTWYQKWAIFMLESWLQRSSISPA